MSDPRDTMKSIYKDLREWGLSAQEAYAEVLSMTGGTEVPVPAAPVPAAPVPAAPVPAAPAQRSKREWTKDEETEVLTYCRRLGVCGSGQVRDTRLAFLSDALNRSSGGVKRHVYEQFQRGIASKDVEVAQKWLRVYLKLVWPIRGERQQDALKVWGPDWRTRFNQHFTAGALDSEPTPTPPEGDSWKGLPLSWTRVLGFAKSLPDPLHSFHCGLNRIKAAKDFATTEEDLQALVQEEYRNGNRSEAQMVAGKLGLSIDVP